MQETVNPYEHLNYIVEIKENTCRVTIGEPELLNLNSFQSLSHVLRKIGTEAVISRYDGHQREWMFLECDDGIYPIILQLIFNAFFCPACKQSFYGENSFENHDCCISNSIDPEREFDWIILLPGLFHLEMNAARALFELCWDPFLKEIVKVLSFTSPRAQEFVKKGSDHHKTWEIVEYLYVAVTDELLVPYIDFCHTNSIKPSVFGYWEDYDPNIKDPNYCFLQQVTLTFLHSLILFRDDVCKGNSSAVQAAKKQIMKKSPWLS